MISDTHGLLRNEVFAAFEEVDRILHAGDVGDPGILDALVAVAPVTAVWGNMDDRDVRERTRELVEGTVGGIPFVLLHGHQVPRYAELPARFPGARLLVHGHSHLPTLHRFDDTVVLNPGSAGPRRPGKPVSLAVLEVRTAGRESRCPDLRIRHLDLETGGGLRPDGR